MFFSHKLYTMVVIVTDFILEIKEDLSGCQVISVNNNLRNNSHLLNFTYDLCKSMVAMKTKTIAD
jgi:hypothetical protein